MKLPDSTIKHIGKVLRHKAESDTKQPLPGRLLFLLEELGPVRTEQRAALRRVWARNLRRQNNKPHATVSIEPNFARHARNLPAS